jgi:flagellar protein FlgJ
VQPEPKCIHRLSKTFFLLKTQALRFLPARDPFGFQTFFYKIGVDSRPMLESQKTSLHLIAQAAVASERSTGCPAELQAAQCILETGWLKHAPGNNCFGIKYYDGAGGRQLLRTHEWLTEADAARFLALGEGRTAVPAEPPAHDARGRKLYIVEDVFATFATLGDCFAYRAAIFSIGRFAPFAAAFKGGGSLEELVRGIAPIYATDPAYADHVLALIANADVRAAIAAERDEVRL